MADTLRGAAIAGFFAVAGALGGAAVTGWSQVKLAEQKFNSDLVLKALESSEPSERLESLRLLVETNLIKDPTVQAGVKAYAEKKEKTPESIPQVAVSTAQTLAAPVVANARIFLMAGSKSKEHFITEYRKDLEAAGFRIYNSKLLEDVGRPATPEIRYFYAQDAAQAQALAEFVRFKLSDETTVAKLYQDGGANPGYIEVWFGK